MVTGGGASVVVVTGGGASVVVVIGSTVVVVIGGGASVVVVVGATVVVGSVAPGAVVAGGTVAPGAVVPGAPRSAVVAGRPPNPPPGVSVREVDGPGVNEPPPPRGAGSPGNVSPLSDVVVTPRIDVVVVEEATALPRSDSDVDVVTRRVAATSAASVTRRARANLAASSARADEAKPPIMAT